MLKEAFHFDDYSYDTESDYEWIGGTHVWNSSTNEIDVEVATGYSTSQKFTNAILPNSSLPNSGYLRLKAHCSFTASETEGNDMGYWFYINTSTSGTMYYFGAIGDDWSNYAGVAKQVDGLDVAGDSTRAGQIVVGSSPPSAVDIDTEVEIWWSPTYARMLIDGTVNQEESFANSPAVYDITNIIIYYNEGDYELQELEVRAWDGKIGKDGIVNHYNFSEMGPVDGLIGYWPMNGDVNDYNNGFQRHGTVSGATIDYTAPRDRKCYDFTDLTDAVILDTSNPIPCNNLTEWSWSCWIYKDSYTTNNDGIAGHHQSYGDGSDPGGRISFYGTTPGVSIYTTTNHSSTISLSGALPPQDEWFHLCITHNTSNLFTFYVNGTSAGSETVVGDIDVSRLGDNPTDSSWDSLGGGVKGLMFDFRIYNRVLTSQEINILATMYNTDGATVTNSMLARYAWNTFGQFKES